MRRWRHVRGEWRCSVVLYVRFGSRPGRCISSVLFLATQHTPAPHTHTPKHNLSQIYYTKFPRSLMIASNIFHHTVLYSTTHIVSDVFPQISSDDERSIFICFSLASHRGHTQSRKHVHWKYGRRARCPKPVRMCVFVIVFIIYVYV